MRAEVYRCWARIVFAALFFLAPEARAEDEVVVASSRRGFGVMSDLVITGEGINAIGGALYDAGRFRFGGGLGVSAAESAETSVAFSGQGYFVLHQSRDADFSLGGSLTLGYRDPPQGEGRVRFAIQGGAQTRFFIVSNGALTAGLGLNVAVGAGGFHFALGSVLLGSVGFQYYF